MSIKVPDILGLPDIQYQGQKPAKSQLASVPNVAYILIEIGMGVRYNMTSGEVLFVHERYGVDRQAQAQAERLVVDMCGRLHIRNVADVREILALLAKEDPYHPMGDWLEGLEWDGEDRFEALAASIETDNPLWPVYLENWLVQVVEGVCGWRTPRPEHTLPYVLVLVGEQGLGKSHWLKRLGGEWLKGEAELHLASTSGKDHQIAALRFPMVELAELDGIFRKADISHMKAFISRGEDEIRAPYARRADVRPRMTAFCGSVNECEFLNDPSGSRRFWPVLVERIHWDAEVDVAQLWAQARAWWGEDRAFDLTPEEDALRAAIAAETHYMASAEEEDIREYFARHQGAPGFEEKAMNRSEILTMLYGRGRRFSNQEVAAAGRIISVICGKHRTIGRKQRAWMVPFNEFATDRATWPDKNHLKSV